MGIANWKGGAHLADKGVIPSPACDWNDCENDY